MIKVFRKIWLVLLEESQFSYFVGFTFGSLGLIGHGFWLSWQLTVNSQNEGLIVGIIGLVSCFCLLFSKFIQQKAPSFFALYYFSALAYNLPFFIFFNLAVSDFSQPWLIAALCSIFFAALVFRQKISLFFSIFSSASAVYLLLKPSLSFGLLSSNTEFQKSLLIFLPILLGAWLLKRALIYGELKRSREVLARSLTSVLTHEIFNPLSSIGMVNSEIEQVVSSSRSLEEDKKFQLLEVKKNISNIAEIASGAMNMLISDLNQKSFRKADFKVFFAQESLLKIIEKYNYSSKEERSMVRIIIDSESEVLIKAIYERFEFIIFILLRNAFNQQYEHKNFKISLGAKKLYFDKKQSHKDIPASMIGKEWNAVFIHYTAPVVSQDYQDDKTLNSKTAKTRKTWFKNQRQTELEVPQATISKLFEDFVSYEKNSAKSHQKTFAKDCQQDIASFGLGFCKKTMRMFGGEIICQSRFGDGSGDFASQNNYHKKSSGLDFEDSNEGWTKFVLLFPKTSTKDSSSYKSLNFGLLAEDSEDVLSETTNQSSKVQSKENVVQNNELHERQEIEVSLSKSEDEIDSAFKPYGSNQDQVNLVDKYLAHRGTEKSSQIAPKILPKNGESVTRNCSHHLLIVDDQEVNLMILKAKIEKNFPTICCDTAKSGLKAVEMVKDRKYDLVFMDIQMPGMSGVEAASKIKNFDQDLQIVAVTSLGKYSFLKDDQKFAVGVDIASLFDGYLSKTVGDNFIMRTLGKWLPGLNDDFCYLGTKREYVEILSGKKILIVDDQQMSRVITRRFLEQSKMKVVEALDGQDMLAKYTASLDNSGKSSFDVIITDVNMPILGGDEAAMQIRKMELEKKLSFHDEVPIIALSGDAAKENIENFFRCGMTDFFLKGNDPEVLIKIIANCLIKNGNQRNVAQVREMGKETMIQNDEEGFKSSNSLKSKFSQSAQSPEYGEASKSSANQSVGSEKTASVKKSFNDFVVLNQTLQENFRSDERQVLIKLFIDNCETMLVEIQKAIESGNQKSLIFCVHSIKGLSANIGAERLLCFIRATEPIIKTNFDLANPWLKKFKVFYDELKLELSKVG